MKLATTLWVEAVQTLLRVLPFPTRTGLVRIGHPGRDAPVLLTGNFRLTVERVKRALRGLDAYLLVANSRGVNVWCAATGGLLTHHDVISVIKTSGIEGRVDHRRIILPQLAATGIEAAVVHRRTGWKVLWGPVEAREIPAYLRLGCQATPGMRRVGFPWPRRLEMAVAWAFPISLLTLPLLPFWKDGVPVLAALIWGLALLIFLLFPVYERFLHTTGRSRGFVFFDLGRNGLPLLLGWAAVLGGIACAAWVGALSTAAALRWGLGSLVLLMLLALDLTGSTPVYKSGLHDDRLLAIRLDPERCRGAGFCEEVCPKGVFAMPPERRRVLLQAPEACVQCGACIVQCPFDALCFERPDGALVPPEVLRSTRLNLLGKRSASGERIA